MLHGCTACQSNYGSFFNLEPRTSFQNYVFTINTCSPCVYTQQRTRSLINLCNWGSLLRLINDTITGLEHLSEQLVSIKHKHNDLSLKHNPKVKSNKCNYPSLNNNTKSKFKHKHIDSGLNYNPKTKVIHKHIDPSLIWNSAGEFIKDAFKGSRLPNLLILYSYK